MTHPGIRERPGALRQIRRAVAGRNWSWATGGAEGRPGGARGGQRA
jgi:hypothetical protein